jgi:penicillin-binding protein 1A
VAGWPRRHRRIAAVLGVLLGAVLLLVAAGGVYLLTLPGVGDAEARVEAILARHGGRPAALPPPARLAAAVVSTEDENFYENVLFNVGSGVGRAALASVGSGEDAGGSTIAQQLAKTLYPEASSTLEQIGLGVKLSLTYPPEQVLSMYLNAIYYGNGYWGDIAAARGYFGVSPRRLTWAEAAMLAGLPQAPTTYDPLVDLRLARLRQHHVLDQLVVNGHLTEAEAARAFREPLPLRSPRGRGPAGSGPPRASAASG